MTRDVACDLGSMKTSESLGATRMGYMAQPDFGPAHIKEIEKKTADAIDAEGWMHTGDKGTACNVAHVDPHASHVSPCHHHVP